MTGVNPTRGRPPGTTHSEVERGPRWSSLPAAASKRPRWRISPTRSAWDAGRSSVTSPPRTTSSWGDFDLVLERLRSLLAATAADVPIMSALADAIVQSNRYEASQLGELRIRMTLITSVPALQAHSMLRYAAWRQVVAEFVCLTQRRVAQRSGAPGPSATRCSEPRWRRSCTGSTTPAAISTPV